MLRLLKNKRGEARALGIRCLTMDNIDSLAKRVKVLELTMKGLKVIPKVYGYVVKYGWLFKRTMFKLYKEPRFVRYRGFNVGRGNIKQYNNVPLKVEYAVLNV